MYGMSILAVCGGDLPAALDTSAFVDATGIDARSRGAAAENGGDAHHRAVAAWAKANKCLFTVVDDNDNPKVVFEFFSGFDNVVDLAELEKQRHLAPVLKAAGISFIPITPDEFSAILDPENELDFVAFLEHKAHDMGLLASA
jgi:hypothetical protein